MESAAKEKPWVMRASHASLAYGDVTVVEDINLEVDLGEMWLLLGANGSGKTTFVRAILGLVTVRSGSLQRNPALGDTQRVGYVPQSSSILMAMPSTVEEVVRLGLVGSHIDCGQVLERIEWALETTRLADLRRRDVSQLSGEALQRTLIARALVRRPTLLVLDEPTGTLDPATGIELLSLIASLHRTLQTAVVLATRDIDVAAGHATHAALFTHGRVSAGPCDDIFVEARLGRAYDGSDRHARVASTATGER